MKIKKGDNVLVISGKDRGKTGKVKNVLPRKDRIKVEGINLRKKHLRPRKAGGKGQIASILAPLHVSNVMLLCPKCGKATRVGRRRDGRALRICKKCGSEI